MCHGARTGVMFGGRGSWIPLADKTCVYNSQIVLPKSRLSQADLLLRVTDPGRSNRTEHISCGFRHHPRTSPAGVDS